MYVLGKITLILYKLRIKQSIQVYKIYYFCQFIKKGSV